MRLQPDVFEEGEEVSTLRSFVPVDSFHNVRVYH